MMEIEFNQTQLNILDSLIGFYGDSREEVIKTLVLMYIEQNLEKVMNIKDIIEDFQETKA